MVLDLLSFNKSKPTPGMYTILLYTAIILVVSQLIFLVLTKMIGVDDVNSDIDNEKDKEYEKWAEKNVSPWALLASEIFNSTIYSPVAEELVFRVVLMKYICVDKYGIGPVQANVIQATAFGAMHLTNTAFSTQTSKYTNLQTLSASITGLVSGWAYVQTNSILPSLFSHMINNASAGTSEVLGYFKYLKTYDKSGKK